MTNKVQSQPLRIECADYWSLGTSRTIRSLLWFVNNSKLEEHTLRFLARYKDKYQVEPYAFTLMGSHDHLLAHFPGENSASFYRDFNARLAEGVRNFVPEFGSGPVFARRVSTQAIPSKEDLEEYFFYCALQPIAAGLCEYLRDYPMYNSFVDAISGRARVIKDIDWASYNSAKRFNKNLSVAKFTTYRELRFKRLPGYEHLTQRQYRDLMLKKFEERRVQIVNERKALGKGFLRSEEFKETKPGAAPHSTKTSTRESKRPLVLTRCPETKRRFLQWYFGILSAYKLASKRYREGELTVPFPQGTYRPPSFVPI